MVQIVLGKAPAGLVVGEGGQAALTVRPVAARPHGQLLVAALTDQGLHLADPLLFAPLVLEPDLRQCTVKKCCFLEPDPRLYSVRCYQACSTTRPETLNF